MPIKPETPSTTYKVDKAALRERLDPIQYQVTQEKGTERYRGLPKLNESSNLQKKSGFQYLTMRFFRPYTNRFYKHYESGVYTCLVCREELFKSETKYHSGSGWPSFYDVIDQSKVKYTADSSGGETERERERKSCRSQ